MSEFEKTKIYISNNAIKIAKKEALFPSFLNYYYYKSRNWVSRLPPGTNIDTRFPTIARCAHTPQNPLRALGALYDVGTEHVELIFTWKVTAPSSVSLLDLL